MLWSEMDISETRFLVLDVDGVMTDGGMYYTESGDEFKKFNSKDGEGIKAILARGIEVGVISAGMNAKLIQRRAALLGIKLVYTGQRTKLSVLKQWCDELDIDLDNVVFVGDDLPDIEVMQAVGIAACPADAVPSVREVSDIVLQRKGGDACIRELIDTHLLPALRED